MKNMNQAQEFFQAPPPGRYESVIREVACEVSKSSGASMLHLTLEVVAPEEYRGTQAHDYLITDGMAKGAGFGKQKLRAIGVPSAIAALDTDAEVPDSVIADEMRGLNLIVEYGNEAMKTQSSEGGPYDKTMTVLDPRTNKEIVLTKLTVKGYSRHNVGAQAQAPAQTRPVQTNFAPQAQTQQAPQQFAPQGYAPQQAPAQQFAQPQFAQPGFAPGAPQFAQPAWGGQPAPGMQPAYGQAPVQGQAPQGWNGGAPSQPPAEEVKKTGRKGRVVDAPQG